MQVAGLVTVPAGSWGGDQVFLMLLGVRVQVARLGGSSDGNQTLWKLQEIVVKVAGLVTVPAGSWGGDQFFLKLSGVGVQVTGLVPTPGGSNGGYG